MARYYCAGPSCPGFSYRASDLAHPASCAKPCPIEIRETAGGPAVMTVTSGITASWLRYRGERYPVRIDANGTRFVDLSRIAGS